MFFAGGILAVVASIVMLAFVLAGDGEGSRVVPDGEAFRVEWLIEPERATTLPELLGSAEAGWKNWDGSEPLRGDATGALWVRITLRNGGGQALRGVLQDGEFYTDHIDAWMHDGRGEGGVTEDVSQGWTHVRMGESLFPQERPWRSVYPAFWVEVPAGGERVVYLRETDHYYPMSRWRWWPRAQDYVSSHFRVTLVKGVFVGALIAVWLYNLVLWVRARFPDTGYYVGYAAGLAVFNIAENGGLTFIGGAIGAPWKIVVEAVSLSVSSLFILKFARVFLETPTRLPRVDRVLRGLFFVWVVVLVGVFAMPLGWADGWLGITFFGVAITHAVLLGAAFTAWHRGFRAARFFVAAFGALFAGGVPALITWSRGGDVQHVLLGLLVVSTLEMLLLSFAVADRFAQTQRRLVEETEQRRRLQETFAEELAVEVGERTQELELANADKDRMLAVIGHDLRSPLAGLMRSADVAKGEFAEEASRTGRALLLMIEDLVLWARLRAGSQVIAVIDAHALTLPAVALHRTLAAHEGVELVVEVPEALRVETDLVLVQTLVRNLLANALKFARTRVVLRAEAVEGGVRFSVGNDGPPLPPDVAKRFADGEDEPITATGGLGLRLCREICGELGLRLEARSAEVGGTEFSVVLPAPRNGRDLST